MNVDEPAPEALKLPIRDRATLAAALGDSLDDPFALAADLDDDEEMASGAVQPLSHSDLMARLRG